MEKNKNWEIKINDDSNSPLFPWENTELRKWHKWDFIARKDYNFSYNITWMLSYEDFLKDYEYNQIHKKINLKANYINKEDNSVILPKFEFNNLSIYIDKLWFWWSERSIKIKDLLYICYNYIFWVKLYTYHDLDTNEKIIVDNINKDMLIENFYKKHKDVKKDLNNLLINKHKLKENWFESKIEKIKEELEWFKQETYLAKNEIWYIFLTPIILKSDNQRDFNNLKSLLTKLAPNRDYSKNDDANKESIIKTGEIFDYFIATSKWYTKDIDENKIHSELLKTWKNENISEYEVKKWIEFIENFLANIL